jgi:hypothetical protein
MGRLAVLALAAALGARSADAQTAGRGKPVLLRLTPRAGDTLRTRFEQDVEMSTAARIGGVLGPAGDSTVTRHSSMLVLARSIVEKAGAAGALVVAVTDSVAITAAGADPKALEAARRAMQGRRARLRVSPAGASELMDRPARMSLADPGEVTRGRFPGTLPAEPVAVGATWTREMPLPWGGSDRPGGKLEVVFRLDSIAADGGLAYVSMRGALSREGGPTPQGGRVATTGTLTGSLCVDLRRGWMIDSRSTFAMTTVVTPPAGAPRGSGAVGPARVKLRVTQRMRAM